ncbi:MAG: T9SS type A sorting domain-containing protein [Saprospiraceae bacterium]|nr:T9SS type A sorting domain-containing protein [Saprospiraceae bacterium]
MLNPIRPFIAFLFILGFSSYSFSQYCTPTTDCTLGDGIREFGIGNFYNASGCEADMGVAGYADFTALTGLELGQGSPSSVFLRSDYADQQVSIWVDTDNSSSFEAGEIILTDFPLGVDPLSAEIIGPDVALGNYRLRVKATWNEPSSMDACIQGTYGEIEDYTVSIVPPPSCPAPSGASAQGITANEATIMWTENGSATFWDLEIVEEGSVPTGQPSAGYDNVSSTSTMVSGLNPVTNYNVFVRADCAGDNMDVSVWSSPASFKTECSIFPSPFYENFNDIPAFDTPPDCWTIYDSGDPGSGPMEPGSGSWFEDGFANIDFAGSYKINLYLGDVMSDWLVSPGIDLTSGGPYQAEFDFSITQFGNSAAGVLGSDDLVAFLASSDNGVSWQILKSWTNADNVDPLGEKIIIDLTAFSGTNTSFAFYGSDGTVDDDEDNDIFVDNFIVREPPSCIEVSAISGFNISDVSAQVGWTENGTASLWDVEFGPTGFNPTGSPNPGYDNVSNPVTLSGLNPTTTYDVYVRADCSGNDTDNSLWISTSFTTGCASYPTPFIEEFDGFAWACWQEAIEGAPPGPPGNITFSGWFSDGFGGVGYEGAAGTNLFGSGDNDWLISPRIDVSDGNHYQAELDFSITAAFSQDSCNLGTDDRISFSVSTDNMQNWTVLYVWRKDELVDPAGQHYIFPLVDFLGNPELVFSFHATNGDFEDLDECDVYFDNLEIVPDPNAPFSVTPNSNHVSCGGADDGSISLMVTGPVPFSFLWSNGETTQTISGLSPGNYMCTITDGAGMTEEVSINITGPPEITSSSVVTNASAMGANDGSIDLSVVGGSPPYIYLWSNGVTTEDLENLVAGDYCATITDAEGCELEYCEEIMEGDVGTEELTNLDFIQLSPNPTRNEIVNLQMRCSSPKRIRVSLLDVFGKRLLEKSFSASNDLLTRFDLSNFASGLYYVQIMDEINNQSMTRKLVKQ